MTRFGAKDLHDHSVGAFDVHAVVFPSTHAQLAKSYWQHTGEGVSSRLAEACLQSTPKPDGSLAKQQIRQRIADVAGVSADDVYLFPTGMNSVYMAHRVIRETHPDRKSIQFGFPYVDTLKILEKFGAGSHFFPLGDDSSIDQVGDLIAGESIAALFTEVPSNPLLNTPDLVRLSRLLREQSVPFIVDDTIATIVNTDLLPIADMVCSSLTKFFSGVGNVAGGSIILSPSSPNYRLFKTTLDRLYEDLVWDQDAIELEANSRDFTERVQRINETTVKLVDFLDSHSSVDRVYHPTTIATANYDAVRKSDGGYSGLFSVLLKDAGNVSASFFDALRLCKGPNLGTNYSLACPYTILAHYQELDFAESCGVSTHLIRVSAGLEDVDDLINRFTDALNAIR